MHFPLFHPFQTRTNERSEPCSCCLHADPFCAKNTTLHWILCTYVYRTVPTSFGRAEKGVLLDRKLLLSRCIFRLQHPCHLCYSIPAIYVWARCATVVQCTRMTVVLRAILYLVKSKLSFLLHPPILFFFHHSADRQDSLWFLLLLLLPTTLPLLRTVQLRYCHHTHRLKNHRHLILPCSQPGSSFLFSSPQPTLPHLLLLLLLFLPGRVNDRASFSSSHPCWAFFFSFSSPTKTLSLIQNQEKR